MNLQKRQTLCHSVCDVEEFSFRKDSSSTADLKHLLLLTSEQSLTGMTHSPNVIRNSLTIYPFREHRVSQLLVTNIPLCSSLCASSNGNLFQPRTERQIGDSAFSVAAPRARNHLPTELKLMRSSTATFRRHLKSFLLSHHILTM